MTMHPSELPCDAVVVLSGHDSVANTSSLYAHLTAWVRWLRVAKEHGLGGPRSALEVVLHEGWSHGWICFHRQEQRKLIRRVQLISLGSGASPSVHIEPTLCVPSTPLTASAVLGEGSKRAGWVRKRRVRFADETADGITESPRSSQPDECDTASIGSSSDDANDSPRLLPL